MIHTLLPTSTSSDVPEASQSDLQALLNKRTEIETSLDEYSAVLDRNRIDLNTPLITIEGYPRADIDVANVRIARAAIIRLRNDYKALERQIEQAVHEAFKNGEPLKIERVRGAAASSQQVASAAADCRRRQRFSLCVHEAENRSAGDFSGRRWPHTAGETVGK